MASSPRCEAWRVLFSLPRISRINSNFCFSQRRDDWLFEPNVSLDKPLAISKLLQVPSLDTLLTWGQVIISTQRAKTLLRSLRKGSLRLKSCSCCPCCRLYLTQSAWLCEELRIISVHPCHLWSFLLVS